MFCQISRMRWNDDATKKNTNQRINFRIGSTFMIHKYTNKRGSIQTYKKNYTLHQTKKKNLANNNTHKINCHDQIWASLTEAKKKTGCANHCDNIQYGSCCTRHGIKFHSPQETMRPWADLKSSSLLDNVICKQQSFSFE